MAGGGDLYFCGAAAAALIPVTVGPHLSWRHVLAVKIEVNALPSSYAVVLAVSKANIPSALAVSVDGIHSVLIPRQLSMLLLARL